MANIERVKKAIQVMERVRDRGDRLYMPMWQRGRFGKKEQALHQCGTAACFAGWLAVSPEFQGDGGEVGNNGKPIYRDNMGFWAIAAYLRIPFHKAHLLCGMNASAAEQFYGVPRTEITPQHVIDKLQELI